MDVSLFRSTSHIKLAYIYLSYENALIIVAGSTAALSAFEWRMRPKALTRGITTGVPRGGTVNLQAVNVRLEGLTRTGARKPFESADPLCNPSIGGSPRSERRTSNSWSARDSTWPEHGTERKKLSKVVSDPGEVSSVMEPPCYNPGKLDGRKEDV